MKLKLKPGWTVIGSCRRVPIYARKPGFDADFGRYFAAGSYHHSIEEARMHIIRLEYRKALNHYY